VLRSGVHEALISLSAKHAARYRLRDTSSRCERGRASKARRPRDPHITSDEARAIDAAIDAYETIIASVAAARHDGLDWYLFDMGSVPDRLATRRYINSPWARPAWWTPYPLPPQLLALNPVPNTRFFRSGPEGRSDGGLFSLDGVHPTTSASGYWLKRSSRSWNWPGHLPRT
jgi:hypothetical protein